jgi:hypothetical protein
MEKWLRVRHVQKKRPVDVLVLSVAGELELALEHKKAGEVK